MAKEVVWVDVDDLGVDTVNIRGGEWDYDEDLVHDIKDNGIRTPLIVRRASPETGKKYAIVCGSRRYNAGIEVGLSKVPCFIEKLDDVTATGWTIAENKHRKGIPAWRYALKIGEMYERLNHKAKKSETVRIIMEKTGFSDHAVYDYLEICGLPAEIIELMKDPARRSEKVKELLKKFSEPGSEKILSFHKAAKIARELAGYPLEKMFEVAAYVLSQTKEVAFEIIERVKTYPKKSMEEIHRIVTGIPKGATWRFEFSSHIVMAIDEACMRKNMDRKSLVTYYLEDALKRDGFL